MTISINWIKQSYRDSRAEFEKFLVPYTHNSTYQQVREAETSLQNAYDTASLISLSNSIWSVLQNTQSWTSNTFTMVEQINGPSLTVATLQKMIDRSVSAPTIINIQGQYELIFGNTQLMLSRILKIQPKVVLIDGWQPPQEE